MANGKEHWPIILCRCGFELLWLPDVQVMGQAIKKHALEDKEKYGLTQEQTESLEDYLITQAFKLAEKSEKPKSP